MKFIFVGNLFNAPYKCWYTQKCRYSDWIVCVYSNWNFLRNLWWKLEFNTRTSSVPLGGLLHNPMISKVFFSVQPFKPRTAYMTSSIADNFRSQKSLCACDHYPYSSEWITMNCEHRSICSEMGGNINSNIKHSKMFCHWSHEKEE